MSENLNASPDTDLKSKVVSGFKWLTMAKFMGQLINWVLSFWVIRLLAPSDYGLMAMAASFIAILALFNEMGMGAVLIQLPELSRRLIQQVFGITLVVNFSLFGLVLVSAPAIALFFAEPQLTPVLRLLAVQFAVTSFLIVPQALLDRELDFKHKSLVDLAANLIAGMVSLTLALNHYGVWSLVWASVILVSLRTLGYNYLKPHACLPSFNFSGIRSSMVFGGQITLEKLLWYLYSQADVLIIGKLLGKDALGFYSVGKHVAGLLADKIMPIVNQVVFPAFSRIQGDGPAVAKALLRGVCLLGLISFPVFWGLSAVSHELIPQVLGAKWEPAVFPLLLISLILPLKMINGILVAALKGIQRADITLQNAMVPLLLMVPAFWLGTTWGINGVCMAWLLVYPVCFFITSFRASRFFMLSYGQIWQEILPTLACTGLMYVGVTAGRVLPMAQLPEIWKLVLSVELGVVIYGGSQWLFNRSRVGQIRDFIG